MYLGGDALRVCFNTVAILFLCEVDNIAYSVGLSENVRARVENAGRVELDDVQTAALSKTKALHIGLLVVCVPASVWLAHATATFGACALAALPLWVGGLAEAVVPGADPAATCKRLAQTMATCALGIALGVAAIALTVSGG